MKKENGITLIALILTIIILIILAGISINSLVNKGLFTKAKLASEEYKNAQENEKMQISKYSNNIDEYIDGTRYLQVEQIEAYKASSTTQQETLSLGTNNITNFDYILLTAKNPNDRNGILTNYVCIQDIEIGTSSIWITSDGFSLQYKVEDNYTLKRVWNGNSDWYITSIRLIKFKL